MTAATIPGHAQRMSQVEQIKPHADWKDPLAGWPSAEEQMNMMGPMVMGAIAKRDRGEALNRMERTLCVGTQNDPDCIPTYSFFTDGPCNLYGYTCRQIERDPKLHAEVVERWTEEFGFEALGEGIDTMNSEIEAMGLITMKLPENVPGDVKIRHFDALEDDAVLDLWEDAADIFNPFTDGRLPRRVELYGHLVERLTKQRGWPVMAAPSATFAQTVNALGFKRAVNWMRRKPEYFERATAAQLKANTKWFRALKSLGVTFMISIDAWNAVPNFRPEQLYRFEKPFIKPLINAVMPTPVIYFYWGLAPTGDGTVPGVNTNWIEFLEKSADTGSFVITNLAPDYYTAPSNDLKKFRETANRLGKSYIVGIKDEVLLSGTPQEIRREVRRVIRELYPCNGGCIIVPNMVPMGTAKENIHAFRQAISDYGKYPIDLERIRHDDAQDKA
jgi:uroporphyrinogen decarboxylase